MGQAMGANKVNKKSAQESGSKSSNGAEKELFIH
jgi:hypothetical protein